MTDDPLTQAAEAVAQGFLATGRQLARTKFIEPTMDNDGQIPPELMAKVSALKFEVDGPGVLVGMVISVVEEAAGILSARLLETQRCRSLESRLDAAESTIRNLMEQVIPQVKPDGAHVVASSAGALPDDIPLPGLENSEKVGGINGGDVGLDRT